MACKTYLVDVLVDEFVGFVATHFADSVLQHNVLLEEVVTSHWILSLMSEHANWR